MHHRAELLSPGLLIVDADLEREFEVRLAETSTLAFRVAYSVLRNRQDAEDVAQEAFLRAHSRFTQLRDRTRFRAWLVRTSWRLAMDFLRGSRRRAAREQIHRLAAMPAGEHDASTSARTAELWAAIDRLPEKLRLTIVLASIEGHDIREVARLMAIPEGTVKSRLFLARQRLKEYLDAGR